MHNKPILFVDFDGVLCHDRYWRSLPEDEFQQIQVLLFGADTSMVHDWMRGKYTAEEVNLFVADQLGISYQRLWDVFVQDCKTMQVSKEVLEQLDKLRIKYTTILLTGNMDSFTRFTAPALQLAQYFDYVSNSFLEQMHKTDNQGALFLKYTNAFNVDIRDCIALDDSTKVCKIFSDLGGTAYVVSQDKDILHHLEKLAA